MKKLVLSKESLRRLEDDTLEKIIGGNWRDNTTVGQRCAAITNCWILCQ